MSFNSNNIIEYLFNNIDNSKYKNKKIGSWIRYFHKFFYIRLIFFIILSSNTSLLQIFLYILVFSLILYIFLKDNILTKLEQKLLNDKNSMVDYILEKLNINKNINNQIQLEFYILFILYLLIIIKLYYIKNK
jgi:hypothetical protein